MKRFFVLSLSIAFGFYQAALYGEEKSEMIPASEAVKHVGEVKTVCGVVVRAKYSRDSLGDPTFLDMERAHPHQVFRVVIWGKDREHFDKPPEEAFAGKRICAKGRIDTFKDVPQIVVTHPDQIRIDDSDNP